MIDDQARRERFRGGGLSFGQTFRRRKPFGGMGMGIERIFSQADFATKLRVPEGTPYVLAETAEEIRAAVESGRAAMVESCNGRAFVWKEDGKYHVDQFFFGPRRELDYEDEEAAVDYAASMCE
jgi:hypothetical protein